MEYLIKDISLVIPKTRLEHCIRLEVSRRKIETYEVTHNPERSPHLVEY